MTKKACLAHTWFYQRCISKLIDIAHKARDTLVCRITWGSNYMSQWKTLDFQPKLKNIYNFYRLAAPTEPFAGRLWSCEVSKMVICVWRLLWNRLICTKKWGNQVPDRMRSWGIPTPEKCVLCGECDENPAHLFFLCNFSQIVWQRLMATMGIPLARSCINPLRSQQWQKELRRWLGARPYGISSGQANQRPYVLSNANVIDDGMAAKRLRRRCLQLV